MKKIFKKTFLCLSFLLSVSCLVQAQLLVTEHFNFSGNLSSNGWTAHSGVGTNPIATTAGLSYTGLLGSGTGNAALVKNTGGEDDNITFPNQTTNGQDIYFSCLVNITDPATDKAGDYFLHLGDGGGAVFTFFAARVFAKITASTVNFGISNSSTPTYGTTGFAKNTTYLLVVKYKLNTTGTANTPVSLWVIPSGIPVTEAMAGAPLVTNTTTAGQAAISALALRQGSSLNSPQVVVDALRVGLTWTDVTPGTAPPIVLTATPLTAFGEVCINAATTPNSFTISSTGLNTTDVTVGPLAGFSFSTMAAGTYTNSLTLSQPGGPYNQIVFVKFSPAAAQSYSGGIPVSGGGANTINVAVSASGANSTASLMTGAAADITANTAVLAGAVSNAGCSNVTGYGIEYSGINNFANGQGTRVAAANPTATGFTSSVNGLVQNTTYYYRAYAINSGGIGYGPQQSFTTAAIPEGLMIYGNPVARGGNLHYSLKGIRPAHYAAKIYNVAGQLVYRKDMILQVNFIDDNFSVPGNLGPGLYSLEIESLDFTTRRSFMIR